MSMDCIRQSDRYFIDINNHSNYTMSIQFIYLRYAMWYIDAARVDKGLRKRPGELKNLVSLDNPTR